MFCPGSRIVAFRHPLDSWLRNDKADPTRTLAIAFALLYPADNSRVLKVDKEFRSSQPEKVTSKIGAESYLVVGRDINDRKYHDRMKKYFRSINAAFTGKVKVLATGSGRIPKTCQIPSISEKYVQLGLKSQRGFFVEVGAYDGESFSNTSFLADEGWRGVYIEPVPEYCRQTKLRHMLNDVVVENVAISDNAGSMKLSVMGHLSTLSTATAAAYQGIPWARGKAQKTKELRVATDTLEHILESNRVPRNFELLVVDVEGHEEPIIRSLLQSKWRPRVVIVELCDLHPDFAGSPELQSSARRVRNALISEGYAQFYADSINSIFLASQRSESQTATERTLSTS